MKILIVEDEVLLADSLKAALEQKGFTVETAYDGETGKEYAELGVYDLLILDVMMPGLDQGRSSGGPGGVHRLPAVRLTAAKNVGIISPE